MDPGFKAILCDACTFYLYVDERLILAIVFVDDNLLGAMATSDLK